MSCDAMQRQQAGGVGGSGDGGALRGGTSLYGHQSVN